MTKAALRRQEREQQARETNTPYNDHPDSALSQAATEAIIQEPSQAQSPTVPHMEPPPPYDAPHAPRSESDRLRDLGRQRPPADEAGCLNAGPGETAGCMNYSGKPGHKVDGCMNFSSGYQGYEAVDGCMNYDSQSGCMNYQSGGGCMNYQSTDGCMNYRSHDGCLNVDVEENSGCLNFRSNRGGCMQLNRG